MQTMNLGKNIKEMRNFRNINKETLAKKCSVDVEIVSKWENREVIPNIEELFLLAKTLKTTVDYLFTDWDEKSENKGFSNDAEALLTVALSTMTAAKFSNPLQRILLKRTFIEELVNLKLLFLDVPLYSVAHTSEKQRRDVVSCFEDIVGEEYADILQGYIDGKNELRKLGDEILERSEEHRHREQEEKDRKRKNPIWKVYITVVDYLESAVSNEFADLRYAKRAFEELNIYLKNKGESVNDVVLESVCKEIKNACDNQDEELIRQTLSFLRLYGDALWFQLR